MFKIGDKVICIKDPVLPQFKVPLNTIFTVTKINKTGNKYSISLEGLMFQYSAERFTLALKDGVVYNPMIHKIKQLEERFKRR